MHPFALAHRQISFGLLIYIDVLCRELSKGLSGWGFRVTEWVGFQGGFSVKQIQQGVREAILEACR